MTKEEEIFKKRLKELANIAYHRNICTYSDFLNLNELNLLCSNLKEISFINHALWGGYKEAERRVVCFYEDDSFPNIDYPVSCLFISPLNQKFSDKLTHRDYLGAVLNLGLDRSKIGDIVVKENGAYLFCHREIKEFLASELTRIKHTSVKVRDACNEDVSVSLNKKEVIGTVTSVRLDALLSTAFHSSRSSLTEFIGGGRVFVNGRQIISNSYVPKEGDIISVRGLGRFQYLEGSTQTKKNRYKVTLLLY